MKTQTKCTLTLSVLFIIELLPIPFTIIYCLYVTRKRSNWLPGVVERLYAEKDVIIKPLLFDKCDPMVTRRRCTIFLSIMLLLDLLTPFTTLFGLYIVRRRPIWFKNVVSRLYFDKPETNVTIEIPKSH
jgi:hypothetical protein